MARVFLASLDGPDGFAKSYVIKRMLPQYASDEQFARMFAIEAKVAALLSHPNIVHVFEFATDGNDYYLVLEYVAGASLDRIVHRARERGIPLGPPVAVEIGLAMARALAYAHTLTLPDGTPLDLVHRDVSPGNVLVSFDGAIKLTDFGVVKTSITATVAGVVKGKWSYMSPEQIGGQQVDQRSDLFSLGVVMYELATGLRLFRGDSVGATAVRVMKATVPPPSTVVPDIHPRFEAILLKLLARETESRYQTAAALAADLEAFRAMRAQTGSGPDLGAMVRTLFPDEGSPSRGLSISDAPASGMIEAFREKLAKPDEDVHIEFEPDGVAGPNEGASRTLVLLVVGACLVGSVIFWLVVF